MLITTTKGEVDESLLTVRTHEQDEGNTISVAREWYLGDGMVRRDCWVTIKRGYDMTAVKG